MVCVNLNSGLTGGYSSAGGLQKVRELPGGFVEGLWVCEGFIKS